MLEEEGVDEMVGEDFVQHLLNRFDLDIARHAIFKSEYRTRPGGLSFIGVYMMSKNETSEKSVDLVSNALTHTIERARKYVGRMNYYHFSQFPMCLESMSPLHYDEIVMSALNG